MVIDEAEAAGRDGCEGREAAEARGVVALAKVGRERGFGMCSVLTFRSEVCEVASVAALSWITGWLWLPAI